MSRKLISLLTVVLKDQENFEGNKRPYKETSSEKFQKEREGSSPKGK